MDKPDESTATSLYIDSNRYEDTVAVHLTLRIDRSRLTYMSIGRMTDLARSMIENELQSLRETNPSEAMATKIAAGAVTADKLANSNGVVDDVELPWYGEPGGGL